MMRAPIDAMHSELSLYAAQLAGAPTEQPVPDYAARAADDRASVRQIRVNTGRTVTVVRNVYPYAQDDQGYWWTCNPQRGWVPVASNSRALLAALADD